ncbi:MULTISPECIES: hypothetical protein [Streptacidiphilus]|uniref:Helix-turn-helix domain-containing protein n=1 Tax=Streptacidiphilus cavernicola TaxID=3342716 RepID=A0ABV6UH81_9ACTN|nr:hypothetical protein [Streptacidiphilus jeojiense]
MHIHRSRPAHGFTVLPNAFLQDRRLSYTARGLLADLLSRPDGWREDGRQMADRSPQGRGAVARALKELTEFGYYRVEKVRQEGGTILSVAHAWDTPQQVGPAPTRPGPGSAGTGIPDALPEKNRQKEPALPAQAAPRPKKPQQPQRGGAEPSAVALLFRVVRAEPRLRLGVPEAASLAPLVAQWLERGCTQQDLAQALLPGLPAQVHSAVALLRDRLVRKLPPAPPPVPPPDTVVARRYECGRCSDPVPRAGICRPCAGLGPRVVAVGGGAAATARGAARVRAALRPAATPITV